MIAAFLGVMFLVTEASTLVLVVTWPRDDVPGPAEPPPGIPDEPPTAVLYTLVGFPDDEPSRVRPYVPAAVEVPLTADEVRDRLRAEAWAVVAGDDRWPHLARQWQDETGSFAAILEAA